MSALDLTPAPGAAPAGRRVTSHAATEAKLLLRNGEQLLLALLIPVGILVLGRILGGTFGDLAVLAPSVLALALWSSAFTSLAIATGFERRYGVLERLAATPLGKARAARGQGAERRGDRARLRSSSSRWWPRPSAGVHTGPSRRCWSRRVAAVLLSGCFGGLAPAARRPAPGRGDPRPRQRRCTSSASRRAPLILPVARYPAAVQPLLELLPTAALGETLRAGAVGTALLWPLPVLLVWTVVAGLAAWKGFRWTS